MLLSVITPIIAEVTLQDVFVDLGGTCDRNNQIYAKGTDYLTPQDSNNTFMRCGCHCLWMQRQWEVLKCTGFEFSGDECVTWLNNACLNDSSQNWYSSENFTTYSIDQSKLEEYEYLETWPFLRLIGCKKDESEETSTSPLISWNVKIALIVVFLGLCICLIICCLFYYRKVQLLQSNFKKERKERTVNERTSYLIKAETKVSYENTIRTLESYYEYEDDYDDGQQWEKDLKELDVYKFSEELTIVQENIGYGSYGVIHVAHGAEESTLLAVKEYHQIWSEMNAEAKKEFVDEIKTSIYLQHRNVVRCYGFTRKPAVRFVMEYCKYGSCIDARDNGLTQRLSDADKVDILIGACRGLVYLCKKDIVHRDIAARNILLDQNYIPKIADFGRSRKIKNDSSHKTITTVGPLKWMSPESIQEQISDFKSDVWSFGVTMWEIMEDKEPYPDKDPLTACLGVIQGLLRTDVSNINTKSPGLAKLILSCFEARDLRPSMSDIYGTLEKIIKPQLKEEVSIVDKFGPMKPLASGAKLIRVDAQNSNRIYGTPKVPATDGTLTAHEEDVGIYSNVPSN